MPVKILECLVSREVEIMTIAQAILTDDEISAILRQRIDQEKQSVGIVVGVIDESSNRIVAYGSRDQTNSCPVDGNTLFEIGSITKVFTTLVLANLVEQGTFKLSDRISTLLPDAVKAPTRNGQEISLFDLATHTSGLPRLPDNFVPVDMSNPYVDYSVEQLYAFLSSYQLPRDIGSQYEYSNLGVGLLGQLLCLKTGMDYETLVKT
jgi:D-alanyl-D-alanine-carboxypeptidase/D-alanyl-D-alanine-endopeptidase